MANEIWHLTNDFLKLSAADVFKHILRDDKNNYNRSESELDVIKLLDSAIILYVESLQAAYRLVDKWENNISNQAAMALLGATLNYILLARHGVLLGYYPEVRDLLRSCFERISSCCVFFHDENFARRFLSGEEIRPSKIREELSKLEQDPDKSRELHGRLGKYYKSLCKVVHPNLKSFQIRYGGKDLDERVGLDYMFGGLQSLKVGNAAILGVLQIVLSALHMFRAIVHEESGAWETEYQKISQKCDEMVTRLKT